MAKVSSKKLLLWDTATGKLARTLGDFEEKCGNLLYSADGKWLASIDKEGGVGLWDVAAGKMVHKVSADSKGIAFSPDSRAVAVTHGDRAIQVIEVATGKELHCWEGFFNWRGDVESFRLAEEQGFGGPVAFSPDSSVLAAPDMVGAGAPLVDGNR